MSIIPRIYSGQSIGRQLWILKHSIALTWLVFVPGNKHSLCVGRTIHKDLIHVGVWLVVVIMHRSRFPVTNSAAATTPA